MIRETKLIFRKRYTRLLFALLICISILLGFYGGVHQTTFDKEDGLSYIKGRKAALLSSSEYPKFGEVSDDSIEKLLVQYQKLIEKYGADEGFLKLGDAKITLLTSLIDVYYPDDPYNTEKLASMKDKSHYSKARANAIIRDYKSMYNSNKNLPIIQDKIELTNKPYNNSWTPPWFTYYRIFSVLMILTAISMVLISSDSFSFDNKLNMDIVLKTLSKSTYRKFILRKLIGTETVATIFWIIITLTFSLSYWQFIPLPALDTPLRGLYQFSIFNVTIGESWIIYLIVTYVCVLMIGAIAFAVNCEVNNVFASTAISSAIIFIPYVLQFMKNIPYALRVVIESFPGTGLWADSFLQSYTVIKAGNVILMRPSIALIGSLIVLVLVAICYKHTEAKRINRRGF